MAKWQQKYRVDWDATDGRNRGDQQTVWEILMEMERFYCKAKEENQGAVALVLDLAKASERVSLPVVWAWATHFQVAKEDLASAVRLFRAPEAGAVRRMRGGAAPDHHGHLARVQVELFASADCIEGCIGCGHKNFYPPLKLRVFVDDVLALLKGKTEKLRKWQRRR